MRKEIIQKICYLLLLGGCATHLTPTEPNSSVGRTILSLPTRPLLWSKRMKGAISGLSVSKNGKSILVATSPDKEIEGSADSPFLLNYDSQGKLRWGVRVKSPVKDQSINATGSLSVISNYNNQLIAINASGKVLWTVEGMCRPILLTTRRSILCYHDDDAEPKIAFDILDENGKKLFSFPIESDILALKISHDEKNIAIALTQGQVQLLNSQYKVAWQAKVPGEVIDLAVSYGDSPKLAVLYQDSQKKQGIAFFNESGTLTSTYSPKSKALQLEVSPKGDSVHYYGNSSLGQNSASVEFSGTQELWKFWKNQPSDYSYSIFASPKSISIGYEEISENRRQSHILSSSYEGTFRWDLPLLSDEGSYLYAFHVNSEESIVVVATDDGRLSVYSDRD